MLSHNKFFIIICLPLELLSVPGLLKWGCDEAALLCSSRVGADLGCESGLVSGALSIGFPHSQTQEGYWY